MQAFRRSLHQGNRSPANLPASGYFVKFILTGILSLFSYLTRFVTPLARRSCFRFAENLTIGFAMGRAESRSANVAVSFSG